MLLHSINPGLLHILRPCTAPAAAQLYASAAAAVSASGDASSVKAAARSQTGASTSSQLQSKEPSERRFTSKAQLMARSSPLIRQSFANLHQPFQRWHAELANVLTRHNNSIPGLKGKVGLHKNPSLDATCCTRGCMLESTSAGMQCTDGPSNGRCVVGRGACKPPLQHSHRRTLACGLACGLQGWSEQHGWDSVP